MIFKVCGLLIILNFSIHIHAHKIMGPKQSTSIRTQRGLTSTLQKIKTHRESKLTDNSKTIRIVVENQSFAVFIPDDSLTSG